MTPETTRDIDTRERLLAAGATLFGQKGFNGCGLNEVLQFASVPKGSFYHYFGSKEEFGVALIERARDAHLEEVRPILGDRKLTPVARLRAIFEQTRAECAATGPTVECLIAKLALETASLSEPVHAAVKCAYQQWSALMAQVIREGQAAGEIARKHDADRLANVLVMLWEGAAIRMQIERNISPLDDFQSFVFDTLLGPPASSGGAAPPAPTHPTNPR
jgi:TetR/AcrR family transcriptional repressor of nem operon